MVLDHFKAIRAAHIDNIWNTYQRHIPDDSFMFNIFVNMSVFILILLSCYVFWEYVKFYKRRSRLLKPLKCIDIDGDFVYNVEECPICLNGFMIPTRLACGHAYCLNCLVTYFSCNNLEWKCICPLCRSLVHSIKVLNNYNRNVVDEEEKKTLEKVLWNMIGQQKKDLMLAKPWKAISLRFVMIVSLCVIVIVIYSIAKCDNCTDTFNNKRGGLM